VIRGVSLLRNYYHERKKQGSNTHVQKLDMQRKRKGSRLDVSDFGQWVLYLQEQLESNDRELAETAGLSPSLITKYVGGQATPTISSAYRLLAACKVLAEKKELLWLVEWERGLLNSCQVGSHEQQQDSMNLLRLLKKQCKPK
jgi:transcriptional regulator with XRE-family HTH domain